MTTVIAILVVVVGVMVSIALHEVGHMVPAKRFGVRVSQFMVGFGPTLWSRTRGETEYGLKAIPFGGFVRMVGMFPPAPEGVKPRGNGFFSQVVADTRDASLEEIRPGEEGRAFYNLSAPKKVVVMLGGPFMNLVIAFVLVMVVMVGIGQSVASLTVATVAPCVTKTSATTAPAECTDADPRSPAVQAGLEPGDTFVSFDGEAVEDWSDLVSRINAAAGETVPVVVDRDGQAVTLSLAPTEIQRQVIGTDGTAKVDDAGRPVTEPGGYVGITPKVVREGASPATAARALWTNVSQTAGMVLTLPVRVADVARTTFSDAPREVDSVMSVVGVGRVAVDLAETDSPILDRIAVMLSLLAALNIALFVFNLIPLLPLDGGHVVNALYEGAKRQIARLRGVAVPGPADVARMMPVGYVVFVVLIGVGALLIFADIIDPVRIT